MALSSMGGPFVLLTLENINKFWDFLRWIHFCRRNIETNNESRQLLKQFLFSSSTRNASINSKIAVGIAARSTIIPYLVRCRVLVSTILESQWRAMFIIPNYCRILRCRRRNVCLLAFQFRLTTQFVFCVRLKRLHRKFSFERDRKSAIVPSK